MVGGAVVGGLVALWVSYAWGHSNAMADLPGAAERSSEVRAQLQRLQVENRDLRLKLAAQETERAGQVRERTALSKTIGELQAEVARVSQDLAFYRGVAGENVSEDVVRIQQFQINPLTTPDTYRLRIVLGRPLRGEDSISGAIKLVFEGTTAATPVNLDLSAATSPKIGELRFSYRYTQTLEQTIQLPSGFKPTRTTLEVQPAKRGASLMRQSFLWTVEGR